MYLSKETVSQMRELAKERIADLKAEERRTKNPSELRSIRYAIEGNLRILRKTHGEIIYLYGKNE